jgi:hypothetical protein
VARVEVIYGAGEPQPARLFPSPPVLGLSGGFWIAPFSGQCTIVSARAFDPEGSPLDRVETPSPRPTKPGQPSPHPNGHCPKTP